MINKYLMESVIKLLNSRFLIKFSMYFLIYVLWTQAYFIKFLLNFIKSMMFIIYFDAQIVLNFINERPLKPTSGLF